MHNNCCTLLDYTLASQQPGLLRYLLGYFYFGDAISKWSTVLNVTRLSLSTKFLTTASVSIIVVTKFWVMMMMMSLSTKLSFQKDVNWVFFVPQNIKESFISWQVSFLLHFFFKAHKHAHIGDIYESCYWNNVPV